MRPVRAGRAAVLAGVLLLSACGGSVDVVTGAAPPLDAPPVTAPVSTPRATNGPDAEDVGAGRKKQATGVRMGKPGPADAARLKGRGNGAGCVRGYGRAGRCLPLVPPGHAGHRGGPDPSQAWTCDRVRGLFPAGITVQGRGNGDRGGGPIDPLRLDADGDGTACGPGDR